VFEAQLQEVSRADAPALVLGRSTLDPAGQAPFRFEIAYDDADLTPRGNYRVRATITHRGRLLYTTDRFYPVLAGSHEPLKLQLVSVSGSKANQTKANGIQGLPASFRGKLPGAGSPILWHLDLLPGGRHQLRMNAVRKRSAASGRD
jgi:putative lipoprotein